MELLGFRFFVAFMHYIAVLKWPLVASLVFFVAYQLKKFCPKERLQALLMFLYFFLIITSFWILKPVKKTLFIAYYAQGGFSLGDWHLDAAGAEQIAKVLNMIVAFLAASIFTLLARSLRRQQLTYVFTSFFAAAYVLYSFVISSPGDLTVWSFYLVGDLFSTLMVATFFAFLNDSVSPESAKRLYGLIGLGGVAGGGVGSSVVGIYVEDSSPTVWLWVCLVLAVAIGLIAMAAGRLVQQKSLFDDKLQNVEEPKLNRNASLEGLQLVLRSRYLLSIVAIVGLYEMASTIMDFQFTSTVTYYLGSDKDKLVAHLSRVFPFTNIIAMGVQLFLTSFIMTRFGIGTALLFLPIALLLGSLGFMAAPVLLIGSLLNTADNGFSYSINQSAKEILYVPTTKDEKYKAKAFIDIFVQRFAKALAVGLNLIISTAFATSHNLSGIRWLSVVTGMTLVIWILAVRYAGCVFRSMEKERLVEQG